MKHTMKMISAVGVAAAILCAPAARAAGTDAVLKTYADIAHAGYEDSLNTARKLRAAIGALVTGPSAETLADARGAWLAARVPYQQTEVYRFGNPMVDDWEGRVNAWPLDEGLIDYVNTGSYGTSSDENTLYTANVIANPVLMIGGSKIDATEITPGLLTGKLHEAGDVESNVATGYHAIEFLLWGQDLNGTGPGAGNRPHTDFDTANCTGGSCGRRAAYLLTAIDLLVSDLQEMVDAWAAGGAARAAVTSSGNSGLVTIVTGMGSLSYGELAGERMKLGLLLHSPEEEHDCFSDNTHASHFNDARGIRNVYLGRYNRVDGLVISLPAVASCSNRHAPSITVTISDSYNHSMGRLFLSDL